MPPHTELSKMQRVTRALFFGTACSTIIAVGTTQAAIHSSPAIQQASIRQATSVSCPDAEPIDLGYSSYNVERPRYDPFYEPPEGFDDCANGHVLRSRKVDVSLWIQGLLSSGSTTIVGKYLESLGIDNVLWFEDINNLEMNAYQILYKTTDGQGRPDTTVTTVVVPQGDIDPTQSGRPIVSHQLAEDGVSTDCAPSYTLQRALAGGLLDTGKIGAASFEFILSLPFLAKGYAVVYTDHEGPQSKWMGGRNSAHMTLDGVKAALNYQDYQSNRDRITTDSKVAFSGYSGGAAPTSWVVEIAGQYAPDLNDNLVGAAIGASPAVDLRAMIEANNASATVGLVALAVVGLDRDNPDAGVWNYVTSDGKATLDKLQDACTLDGAIGAGIHLLPYGWDMNQLIVDSTPLVDTPPAKILIPENSVLGQDHPKEGRMPVLYYHHHNDGLVPVDSSNKLVREYCAADSSSPVTVNRIVGLPSNIPIIDDILPEQLQLGTRTIAVWNHVHGEMHGMFGPFLSGTGWTTGKFGVGVEYIANLFNGKTPRNDCKNIPQPLPWPLDWIEPGPAPWEPILGIKLLSYPLLQLPF